VAAVSGSHYVEVGVAFGDVVDGRRIVTCISALDNLVKGGAGQGIQNMNLVLGLDERLSLEDPGSYP
ncbi:MAG: N-acetyl-gamma-glutamyl-phosphate reductase, partial [Myxococcota bacterium]